MGDKYIIEKHEKDSIWRMYADAYGDVTVEGVDLTPYTEPDTEQVREEAYEQGRKVGIKDGMCEAWETAKKVTYVSKYGGYGDCLDKVFDRHDGDAWDVFDYSPTEVIEKIRQYEQEKEEQIIKGDIVLIKSTPEVEILATYADEEYVSGIALTEVDGNCEIGDQYIDIRICNVEKTGKHYDIVSVLQKMKES